jgi:hypothetical protein
MKFHLIFITIKNAYKNIISNAADRTQEAKKYDILDTIG